MKKLDVNTLRIVTYNKFSLDINTICLFRVIIYQTSIKETSCYIRSITTNKIEYIF
jgi:hypothetical protein